MARYELSDGKSNKFWEIVIKGSAFTTIYGRIGTDGQSKTKEFSDASKAKAEAEKLTAQKVKKGYAPAKSGKKTAAKAKAPARAAKPKAAPKKASSSKSKKTKATTSAAKTATAKKSAGYRFELTDGKSSKFWEILLAGESFTTTYGRIGADGTSGKKSFASPAIAKKKHDALIAEKTKKGYVLVGGELPRAMTARSASNAAMEAAIAKDPGDDAAWGVYADWLQGQGDPRGELAAVQMAMEAAKGASRAKLKKTEKKLFEDYGDYFQPPILAALHKSHGERAPKKSDKWEYQRWQKEERLGLTWKAGFMADVNLRKAYDEKTDMEDILAAILSHSSSRLLQSLNVGPLNIGDTYDYCSIVKMLAKGKLPALRTLYLAEFSSDDSELSWSEFGDLGGIWKAAPNLTDVTIRAGDFSLGSINLPRARSFTLETVGTTAKDVKAIASAKWPALEKLAIWLGSAERGGVSNAKAVQPLLEGKSMPRLTDLGLMNCEVIDDICKLLPKSKIARQLVRLDLSKGTLSDVGVEALAATPKAFPKLEEVVVARNYVSKDGLKLLKKIAKTVVSGYQDTPSDWGDGELRRFVAVGE